jgi:membrane protein
MWGQAVRKTGVLTREAWIKLGQNDPLILASSTAFFTTFAILPILIILTNVLGLYFRNQELNHHLSGKLQEVFGIETSKYLGAALSKLHSTDHNWLVTLAGMVFLAFVATNLFKIVKLSINRIWNIKRKHVSRVRYTLRERAVALTIILITAALVGVSILLDTALALMNRYLHETVPAIDLTLLRIAGVILSLIVTTTWFMFTFKLLPDAKVHWRVAAFGGFVTALLFNLGKWVLGKLLIYSAIASVFGASASLALLLLFIFYAALILYYGAAFTYAFGESVKLPIVTGKYSEKYEVVTVDDVKSEN